MEEAFELILFPSSTAQACALARPDSQGTGKELRCSSIPGKLKFALACKAWPTGYTNSEFPHPSILQVE
jgi:hypothetical protein